MDRDEKYINEYGNIKYCYRIHVRKMVEKWEPYTTYAWFWTRIKKKGRPIYMAIHTPAREKKVWLMYKVKHLFRKIIRWLKKVTS